eukprot:4204612-Prymnesium_polylepis.1
MLRAGGGDVKAAMRLVDELVSTEPPSAAPSPPPSAPPSAPVSDDESGRSTNAEDEAMPEDAAGLQLAAPASSKWAAPVVEAVADNPFGRAFGPLLTTPPDSVSPRIKPGQV